MTKKVYVCLLVAITAVLVSCTDDSDIEYDILKSLEGTYELADIGWTGEAFDWNGDNVASDSVKDEFDPMKLNGSIRNYMIKASAHGTLSAYFPVQIGDTSLFKEPDPDFGWSIRQEQWHDIIRVNVEKTNGKHVLTCENKTDSPVWPTSSSYDSNLSHYTHGITVYDEGKFILSYDAVFFDPVSWKDVSGRISFTYAIKPEE